MALQTWLGLGRSLAIYYGNPLRRRALVRFYAGLLPKGALAFDVGAHVGNRTRALRAAGARVVAVEPQHPFAAFLRHTLPRDVVLVEAAAGPAESVAEMAVSSLHPTVSSLRSDFAEQAAQAPGFGHVVWDRRQTVQVTTLDALIARHGRPDFIKIDVEGFELDVLRGLSRPVPMIAVEYLPGLKSMTAEVIGHLATLGPYRFNAVRGEDGRFLWDDWRDATGARTWLDGLTPADRSGDLYARLG